MSARNADTYSHVAAGIYFSRQCNRAIPFPTGPRGVPKGDIESPMLLNSTGHPHDGRWTKRAHRNAVKQFKSRAESCPLMDDFIIWDGSDEDLNSIGVRGYAHFGDSYASGMGTGTTTWNKCRVGSNNYGDLLYQYFGDSSLPYERRSCSGDTTDGLYAQIEGWSNAPQVNVVTLTIGGNDLGFSDLVKDCVVSWGSHPSLVNTGAALRKSCLEDETKARDHMNDLSENGLRARMKEAYLRILSKANSGKRVWYHDTSWLSKLPLARSALALL